MKKIIAILITFSLVESLEAQPTPAMQVSQKIAQKMQDSLLLNAQQKDQIYAINMQLHEQKAIVYQQYSSSDLLTYYIQKVENTRDSLYRQVLTETKYQLYKLKKTNLVNNK